MKLNIGVMLKTIGAGLVINTAVVVVGQAANLLTDFSLTRLSEPTLSSNGLPAIVVTSCVSCICYVIIGILYGWFALRSQEMLPVGHTALGAGISTAIASTIVKIAGVFYTVATAMPIYPVDPAAGHDSAGSGALMAIVAVYLGIYLCAAAIFPAGLGAAGGAFYAAVAGRRQAQKGAQSV